MPAVSSALAELSQAAMSLLVLGEPAGLVASAVSGAGGVTLMVVSAPLTVIFDVLVLEFPAASLAVQVTVVSPPGNTAGASLESSGLGSPPASLSVA